MRIAYFVNQYPKVSHSFIRREIIELENQGLEVFRYSVKRDGGELVDPSDIIELKKTNYIAEGQKLKIVGIVFHALISSPGKWLISLAAAFRMGWRSHVGILRHLIYFVEACVLVESFLKDDIKHVHAHFGTNSTSVVMLAKLLGGVPYSFMVHGPEEFDKPEALSLEEKINHASFVTAISSFCRSQLYRWCDHSQWKKIHIVHCALDADFLDAEPKPTPDNNRLVCVGRLCEQKGQLLLIEAIHRLNEKGIKVELVLAGDGPMRGEIERLTDQYNLSEQVCITGWISSSKVLEEIVNSRALVLPSFAEGLPVVLMEACALRRPSVTTYIAAIPELIQDGKSGWLVPAGSIELLCDALIELLTSSTAALDQMGENAYLQVKINHDIRTECAILRRLFSN